MLGRAATAVGSQPHVIAASAYYVRAPRPGPVAIDAELLRRGRSTSHLAARMSQGDEVCVQALLITSRLDATGTPHWERSSARPSTGAFEDCPRLHSPMPDGTSVAMLDEVDMRLEPETRGFERGEPSGRGELRGWLALPGEDFDPAALLFAVDAFPPGTFDVDFAGPVPTLELTVYVRALPAPGPVRVLQRAELIDGQLMDESCYIWDARGRLVAKGRQLGGIPPG